MDKQELIAERARLLTDAEAILLKAKEENRFDLTGDENKKWEELHAEADKRKAFIDKLEKHESLAEPQGRRSEQSQPNDGKRQTFTGKITDRDRGEALRAWMCAGMPEAEPTQQQRDLARRCGVNIDSKKLTFTLGPAMKPTQPDANGLRASEEDKRDWQSRLTEERAALTGLQSSTTTGGYTVADEAMRSLEVALLAFGGMRSTSTVIRTATGGPLPIPTTNDTANKGAIIGENTTSTELEMTFGQLVLDAWKYSSKYILASIEFLQDTSINANQFLGEALGIRIARITNDHFTTGTGSQPNGIVTASTTSGITTAAAQTITYDNLVDVVHSVDPSYRVNGKWMLHDSALKVIKKIKVLQYSGDTTGAPLWVPGLASGQPDTILGYSYVINQSLAATGAGTKSVLFGQLDKYIIRDVKDVTVLRMDELFAVLGQVAFLALSRHDGDLLDAGTNPVKHLIQGA
jgi:HK97 family phage major capsid protein